MNTNVPETPAATGTAHDFLQASAAAHDAGKTVRKEAAKTARANGVTYREIAKGLNLSVTRAYRLVNEDAA